MPRLCPVAVLVVASLTLGVVACSPGRPNESNYLEGVALGRASKDAQFASASDSPIPPDRRSVFLPLAYFPVDPTFVVPASLEEAPPANRPIVQFDTSRQEGRTMQRVGVLRFSFKGQPLQLSAFVEQGQSDHRLFVPFTDLTSGKETYRAGRYLDIDRTPTGIYTVDFNRAYNPYCYYNDSYDCPFPPRENRLPVEIKAGERVK